MKSVTTPRGSVTVTDGKAELKWDSSFVEKWHEQYSKAQKFVDSEVLRLCEPYVPLLTGMLVMSGILGTDVGSGEVAWIAPYARYQYYLTRKHASQTGPLRGPHWFERMKQVHGLHLAAGARKIAGGGT
jgi:hypothetical protein